MSANVAKARASEEVRSYDSVGRKAVKANLKSPILSDGRTTSDFSHGLGIWDALVTGHGSVNAAAITMENTDPSQLKRLVVDGDIRLKKLFSADARALCALADYILLKFATSRKTPKQLAREQLAELQRRMGDLQRMLDLDGEA
jgi:hypothetical protein